ncbi:ribonuclease HI [Croceimicrobium hydrocarbonivorans]|uniref:ribonuclease H n=1 Tax=Croceimicrobium hydrocarbonivorans TaxID=2761580 RepID=A0A7H0VJG5_9FLAO|nr:ribonuclease HI [Croceimicrobium hydrocarbonivorans]QNR25863.1 ribonuclease HI [Croceimicrobium hydrocarbonivorans]
MQIHLYTDGAAKGNPGPGGYGIVLEAGPHRKELSGGFRRTTNNRMELLAVIVGLEALKNPGQQVRVVSDSKYVVDAINKGWLRSWIQKGFKGKKNIDLWKRLIPMLQKHQVQFQWVKGHNDHPQNERCDRLAVAASEGQGLPIDHGFENLEGL